MHQLSRELSVLICWNTSTAFNNRCRTVQLICLYERFRFAWNRSSSIDQKSVRVWFVHWSRNAKCVVTRVLAVCEHWACARVQHISHIINSFFIVSRVLHRIMKTRKLRFLVHIILRNTLETIKSRWLSVTWLCFKKETTFYFSNIAISKTKIQSLFRQTRKLRNLIYLFNECMFVSVFLCLCSQLTLGQCM